MSVWSASSQKRNPAYLAWITLLVICRFLMSGGMGNAWVHTLLEFLGTVCALNIGAIALARYYAKKDPVFFCLGGAFLASGLAEALHAAVTVPGCVPCNSQLMLGVVAWSGYTPGIVLSLVMCLQSRRTPGSPRVMSRNREWQLCFLAGAAVLMLSTALQFIPTRVEFYPNFPIHRPVQFITGTLYTFAAWRHWRRRSWTTSQFEHCLMLFLITSAVDQILYMPLSNQLMSGLRYERHVLKIVAYAFVAAGLLSDVVSTLRGTERALSAQKCANSALAREVEYRHRAESALEEARLKLEQRAALSARQLTQQDELATLASRIALALTQSENIDQTLQRSAEIICASLDISLIRIWTLNKERTVLELRSSAGMYTSTQGPHSCIPLGSLIIGKIAQHRVARVTDDLPRDGWLVDKEWARREGMTGFAGFPLMLEDRVEGVIAAFSRNPLAANCAQTLGSIAGSLGLFIGRRRAEAALQESEQWVRLLLDSTAEAIYAMDTRGNCTLANRSGVRMLGYQSQDDLLGRNMHELMHHSHPDGSPYPMAECPIFRAFLKGEEAHSDHDILWRADGASFPAEYWTFPIRKNDQIIGAVVTFLDISARKQAEEEQRRLVSLVESSDDFIAIASPEGRLLYLNGGGARMIGLDNAQEAMGLHISKFHPEAAWAHLGSTFEFQLAAGHYQCETQLRHWKTSAPIDVLFSSFVLRDPDSGQVQRIGAIMRDITARKKAEQALRISEERFRIAAENAGDLTIDVDLRTGEVDLFGSDRFGGQPAPRTFEAWTKTLHPDDIEPVLQAIEGHIASGERYKGGFRVLSPNGDLYHYSLRAQAVRDSSGQPTRWIGVVSDITEQRRAEDAIAHLAAIVQHSEDAIIGYNLAGVVTTWNRGAEKLIGYSSEEAVGTHFGALLAQPERAAELVSRSARGEVCRVDQTTLRCKDVSSVPVSLTLSPIRDVNGDVSSVAAIARDMTAQVKAEIELAHQARHDHLTGLPNRLLFADRLAASIAHAAITGLPAAVIYLDLDSFKLVNDSLGHETGDTLLQLVSERLKACVREPDTLARMGGDEFMLVINELSGEQAVLCIAEQIAASLRKPYSVCGRELYLTASLGISMYPRDGADVSTLRRNADAAMYQAKHAGKDRIVFFTPVIQTMFLERLDLESDLRHALEQHEFFLEFQPLYDAQNGKQTAFEALIRWRHPSRGVVMPGRFIPVAEDMGLILRLGPWVLRQACEHCRSWQDHGFNCVRVTVNVSPLEFARVDFAESVLRVLDESRLRGDLLELEVTEGMVMRDLDDSIAKMLRLHERGIRISVDDFGTGYSSLGYLPRLPVDTIKIDRSFVSELDANTNAYSLIGGMISLAHSIDKRVVVEGVETGQQLAMLQQLGCDEVQGFLLGRPAPIPRFEHIRPADNASQGESLHRFEPSFTD